MHLVVVQHGLWGYPANTAHLSLLLRERLTNGYFILNSDVNSGNLTYDGIDVCGDRLHALILTTVESLTKAGSIVNAISLIGYSMGGLVTRYVAGKLYAEGFFAKVAPVNFITVATPHLGAWRMPSSWYNRAFNYMVPVVTSRSGYQLVLQDKHVWGKPLLCLMSHPELVFMQALAQFRKLMLLANVFHDRPVPYCTAAIRLDNPYEKSPPVPIDPAYPSIVTTAAAAGEAGLAATAPKPACRTRCAVVEAVTSATAGAGATQAHPSTAASDDDQSRDDKDKDAAPSPLARRPLRSTYLPLLMVVFLPLAIPALLLMVITGRSHHRRIMRTALDFSWIQRHSQWAGGSSVKGAAGAAGRPEVEAAAGGGNQDQQHGEDRGQQGRGQQGPSQQGTSLTIECPSAPELPRRKSSSKALPTPAAEVATGAAGGAVTTAPASSTAVGALDDGDDAVVVSEQSVLLHDGIVELPAEVHVVQEWLVEQLNKLPWQKVDVDCRDFHAHAAIIMRNPARFTHNKDVLDYLIDQFVRT